MRRLALSARASSDDLPGGWFRAAVGTPNVFVDRKVDALALGLRKLEEPSKRGPPSEKTLSRSQLWWSRIGISPELAREVMMPSPSEVDGLSELKSSKVSVVRDASMC